MHTEIIVNKDAKSITLNANNELGHGRQQSFQLNTDDIIIISLTTKFEFDDEEIYITLVDQKGKLYHIHVYYLSDSFFFY